MLGSLASLGSLVRMSGILHERGKSIPAEGQYMPRYSISNAPTEVVGLDAGSGVFRGRLGDIVPAIYI